MGVVKGKVWREVGGLGTQSYQAAAFGAAAEGVEKGAIWGEDGYGAAEDHVCEAVLVNIQEVTGRNERVQLVPFGFGGVNKLPIPRNKNLMWLVDSLL